MQHFLDYIYQLLLGIMCWATVFLGKYLNIRLKYIIYVYVLVILTEI